MQIIKETDRQIGIIRGYKGICEGCGTPLEYDGELVVIEVQNSDDRVVVVCKDIISCPHCSKEIYTLKIYKNMDISNELSTLENKKNDRSQ